MKSDFLFTVRDWGTETDGTPRPIDKKVFRDSDGRFFIHTPASRHSGLYSHGERREHVTAQELVRRYEHSITRHLDKLGVTRAEYDAIVYDDSPDVIKVGDKVRFAEPSCDDRVYTVMRFFHAEENDFGRLVELSGGRGRFAGTRELVKV